MSGQKTFKKSSKKVLTQAADSEMLSAHTEQQIINMRTKTLLLGAAALAASVMTSMAQNVYSVNVVGYVNVTLTNGFNLIANPLDAFGGGTGTGNTIGNLFTALPDTTTVYKLSGGAFTQSDEFINGPGWLAGGTITFNPGEGIFIQIPNGIPGNSTNITFVGTVMQNSPTTVTIKPGYNIAGSQAPITGLLTTTLNYQPQNLDTVYVFSPVSQSYPNSYQYITGPGWLPNEPTLNVGQSIWIQNLSGTTNVWTNTFVVQ
jgi:hypothetical protein